MENATKALLIAAGVLIVILLVAVSVRILNSTTGIPDSVEALGGEMTYRAISANAKMFINSINYKNDEEFSNAVKNKYDGKVITAEQAAEFCLIIMERGEMVSGNIKNPGSIRLSTGVSHAIYYSEGKTKEQILSQIVKGNIYSVRFEERPEEGEYAYSVVITKK